MNLKMIQPKSTAASKQKPQVSNGEQKSTSTGRNRKRHSDGKLKDPPLQQQQSTTTAASAATTKATTATTKAIVAKKPKTAKKPNIKKNPVDPKGGVSSNWQRLQSQLAAKKAEQKKRKTSSAQQEKQMIKKKNKKVFPLNNAPAVSQGVVNGGSSALSANGEVWFDDVDPCLVQSSMISSSNSKSVHVGTAYKLCKETSFDGLTRAVAMDCEMVGTGYQGGNSILARVSIVNLYGHCIYDKFVKPTEEVTDYRTDVSGIRPENLANADDFKTVQNEVFSIIHNRVLVGHAVHHDLKVLFLSHPKTATRDTCHYFKKFFNNRNPSLKKLAETYLGVQIQNGEHDSITDAQATMRLYTLFKKKWEAEIGKAAKQKRHKHTKQTDIVPLINTSGDV
ncbi:REX4, RNA exonuclease 4 [Tyrophagus putrescentiae]|nr:REX4, RNA exonuclease 4 [Tyrophagus putrescentiae]